ATVAPFRATWATSILNNGSHSLRAIAVDLAGNRSVSSSVSVMVSNILPVPNQSPVVHAGSDRTITYPAPLSLGSVVLDDGLPSKTLQLSWSNTLVSGNVSLSDSTSAAPTATFSAPGTYTLKLTATDGQASSSDQLQVTVNADTTPPSV